VAAGLQFHWGTFALGEHKNLVGLASRKTFALPSRPLHFNVVIGKFIAEPNVDARIIL